MLSFWLVPNPVRCWFERMVQILFDRLGEVVFARVPVHKEDRRKEFLIVLLQLTQGQRRGAARVVPVEKEFTAAVPINESRRFMHHDKERWIRRPTFFLACQIEVGIRGDLTSVVIPKICIEAVTAPDGFIIARFEWAATSGTFRKFLTLIRWTPKRFKRGQVAKKMAIGGFRHCPNVTGRKAWLRILAP